MQITIVLFVWTVYLLKIWVKIRPNLFSCRSKMEAWQNLERSAIWIWKFLVNMEFRLRFSYWYRLCFEIKLLVLQLNFTLLNLVYTTVTTRSGRGVLRLRGSFKIFMLPSLDSAYNRNWMYLYCISTWQRKCWDTDYLFLIHYHRRLWETSSAYLAAFMEKKWTTETNPIINLTCEENL